MRITRYKRVRNQYSRSRKWSVVEYDEPFGHRRMSSNYTVDCRAEYQEFFDWLELHTGKRITMPD